MRQPRRTRRLPRRSTPSRATGCARCAVPARSTTRRSRACTRCCCAPRASRSRAAGRRSRTCAATSSTTSPPRPPTTRSLSVLRRLDDFRGASRFTTWAYKFALLEAAVKLRRRAWQGREIPLEPETLEPVRERGPRTPSEDAEQGELLAALQRRDRRGADPAPAARPRRAGAERRADRRARRAPRHDARCALQDAARRAAEAARGISTSPASRRRTGGGD